MGIVWEKEGGVGDPSEADQVRILAQIRERAALIEREAVEMGMARMREGRRTPRRHMRVAYTFLFIMVAVALLVYVLGSSWPF